MPGSYSEPEPVMDRREAAGGQPSRVEPSELDHSGAAMLGEFRYPSPLNEHERFYQLMLQRKREAIRREEVEFQRNLAAEVRQIRHLEQKEQTLIHTLNDE